ncbi:hypothetical protein [uncultured Cohaesibacter sp.]|uniref:hypothetical protein n=1 Tax=uncultured Cohaesibacter sp. TaxID=1002546 RepID=UPI0029C5FBE4|nr:hypothetical protein [uncultured Cohaesibacter sp.]
MRNERPFRQEAYRRQIVVCNSVTDALEHWRIRTEPRIKKIAGSILLLSYLQSGLGNRDTMALAFSTSEQCGRFVDELARVAIEGR